MSSHSFESIKAYAAKLPSHSSASSISSTEAGFDSDLTLSRFDGRDRTVPPLESVDSSNMFVSSKSRLSAPTGSRDVLDGPEDDSNPMKRVASRSMMQLQRIRDTAREHFRKVPSRDDRILDWVTNPSDGPIADGKRVRTQKVGNSIGGMSVPKVTVSHVPDKENVSAQNAAQLLEAGSPRKSVPDKSSFPAVGTRLPESRSPSSDKLNSAWAYGISNDSKTRGVPSTTAELARLRAKSPAQRTSPGSHQGQTTAPESSSDGRDDHSVSGSNKSGTGRASTVSDVIVDPGRIRPQSAKILKGSRPPLPARTRSAHHGAAGDLRGGHDDAEDGIHGNDSDDEESEDYGIEDDDDDDDGGNDEDHDDIRSRRHRVARTREDDDEVRISMDSTHHHDDSHRRPVSAAPRRRAGSAQNTLRTKGAADRSESASSCANSDVDDDFIIDSVTGIDGGHGPRRGQPAEKRRPGRNDDEGGDSRTTGAKNGPHRHSSQEANFPPTGSGFLSDYDPHKSEENSKATGDGQGAASAAGSRYGGTQHQVAGGDANSFQWMAGGHRDLQPPSVLVQDIKNQARKNMLRAIHQLTVDDVRARSQAAMEEVQRQYDLRIIELNRLAEASNSERILAMEELHKLRDENSALKNSVDMLRMKLQRMSEREIDMQKKLSVFERIEPIFENLRDLKFASPEDVLTRLEKLEQSQVESYTSMLEARERCTEAERDLENVRKEVENTIQSRTVHLAAALKQAEKKCAELQASNEMVKEGLEKSKQYQDKYLTLHSAVVDLYHRWIQNVETVTGNSGWKSLSEVKMSDPMQIMSALVGLIIEFSPSKAGKAYQELSGIANSFWSLFLEHDPVLKAKPRDIFIRVGELLSEEHERMKNTSRMNGALMDDVKGMRERIAALERDKRQLQSQLDGKNRQIIEKARTMRDLHSSFSSTKRTSALGSTSGSLFGTSTSSLNSTLPKGRPSSATRFSEGPRSTSVGRQRPASAIPAASGSTTLGRSRPGSAVPRRPQSAMTHTDSRNKLYEDFFITRRVGAVESGSFRMDANRGSRRPASSSSRRNEPSGPHVDMSKKLMETS